MVTLPATLVPTRWSLEDLFAAQDSPDLRDTLARLETQVAEYEKLRESLRPDLETDAFLGMVRQLETISRDQRRVYYFAHLRFAEDTQDQKAVAFMGQMQQLMTELHNRLLFFELWWKQLDDENAERLMSSAGDYRYWLEEMRNFKPHTLTEPEEKILNIKNVTGSHVLETLYDSITNRYVFRLEVDGEVKELTRDALMVYVQGDNPELRAAAYQELYRVYEQDAPILGQIYQALVRDWRNEQVQLRKFASPISARNLSNDLPDQVVDTLLEVCQRNAPLWHRYFALKARWLGLERLRRYDIYAPVAKAEKEYEFSKAADLVIESLGEFDPRLSDMVARLFAEGHVDSEVRQHKQGGAFCATALPDLTPWVLLNYQGRARDVATLAHEFGHAIHSMLAADHSTFTFHAALPLAETASTFGEMLLVDHMLEQEADQAVRRDILFRQVDDAYATIGRQAFFALFERQAHDEIQAGATVDELSDTYFENLKTQFGDSLEISDEFRWEWITIPHIYSVPFYVYAYSFGQLLVFSLYQQYRAEGEAFKPRYLEILSAGGSEAPERILNAAGVDIRSAKFWQGGFDVIEGLIEQLEAIPTPE